MSEELAEPVHKTTISTRSDQMDEDEFRKHVASECKVWFDDRWDQHFGDWTVEFDASSETMPTRYFHANVSVEANDDTPDQLLGNWANRVNKTLGRYTKGRPENPGKGNGNE